MIMSNKFYQFFDQIKDRLGVRQTSFSKIFEYLDKLEGPINIVETGCLRIKDNFNGDGQSTLLFDKYTLSRETGSKVYTVDIDPNATKTCKSVVSENVEINTGDSVKFLIELMKQFEFEKKRVSLFYLDSYDVNWQSPHQSAAHHLKELTAIINLISEDTLIVVDDAPIFLPMQIVDNKYQVISNHPAPGAFVGGKGYLVNEYANVYGAKVLFSNYQTAWTGFKKNK